jgi:phenol 2-monooxygenase
VWGVIDFVPGPATDFPGVRQKSYVFSQHGSCLLIPRERDIVRVYKQLDSKAVLDAQGLVDRKLVSPEQLMKVRGRDFVCSTG